MEINRKQIMANFLRILDTITDKEYQEKVWIQGEGPDFDETVCHFFDDGEPIFEDYKAYGISDDQYQLLIEFKNAFEAFSDEHNLPLEFINTSEWGKIMQMAKDVLKTFTYLRDVL